LSIKLYWLIGTTELLLKSGSYKPKGEFMQTNIKNPFTGVAQFYTKNTPHYKVNKLWEKKYGNLPITLPGTVVLQGNGNYVMITNDTPSREIILLNLYSLFGGKFNQNLITWMNEGIEEFNNSVNSDFNKLSEKALFAMRFTRKYALKCEVSGVKDGFDDDFDRIQALASCIFTTPEKFSKQELKKMRNLLIFYLK
jgi:hypothetical protein